MRAGLGNPDSLQTDAEGTQSRLLDGLYVLTNRRSSVVLGVLNGDSKDGTWCMGFNRSNTYVDHQLWSITSTNGPDQYTLQNLRSGTFLTFPIRTPPLAYLGFQNVLVWVESWRKITDQSGTLLQEWRLEQPNGAFTLQCGGTNTYLEYYKTLRINCITCSPRDQTGTNTGRSWDLQRVSRSGEEIKNILLNWKSDLESKIFQPHPSDTQHFVLPHELRTVLLSKVTFNGQGVMEHASDYDGFVTKAKNAVNSWARERLRVKGYSVIFGIIYGNVRKEPRMYNWYLTPDMHSLVFLDARRMQEYTRAALDGFGFEPVFVTF